MREAHLHSRQLSRHQSSTAAAGGHSEGIRTLWPVLLCEAHAAKVEPLVWAVCRQAAGRAVSGIASWEAGRRAVLPSAGCCPACWQPCSSQPGAPGFSQAIISPNEMRWQWQYLGSLGSAIASACCIRGEASRHGMQAQRLARLASSTAGWLARASNRRHTSTPSSTRAANPAAHPASAPTHLVLLLRRELALLPILALALATVRAAQAAAAADGWLHRGHAQPLPLLGNLCTWQGAAGGVGTLGSGLPGGTPRPHNTQHTLRCHSQISCQETGAAPGWRAGGRAGWVACLHQRPCSPCPAW